ncbi:pre-60S ribosomal particles component [Didymosphaeria variabile]|uniref:Pre-60S ribosomal particles component n=1 Tax=Didymosphaeria variabile TaxID=1932322 RepID=A0A9W9C6J3_9PLEO|nr:pre-60S ribosomal particles component [Didymosphaeria variabile]KAJ4346911.1 pre-60S ribosomal particles component [Didymosphaeria variabile]
MPNTSLKRRRTEDRMRGKVPKKDKPKIKRQKFYHSSSEDESDDEGAARDAPREVKKLKEPTPEFEPEAGSANALPIKERTAPAPAPAAKKSALKKTAQPAPLEAGDDFDDVASSDDAEDSEPEDRELAIDSDADDSDASDDTSISEVSTNNPARKVRKRNDPEAFATSISKILNTKLTSQKRSEPILSRSKSAQEANRTLSDQKLTHAANKKLLAEKKAAQEKGRVKDVLGLNDPSVSTAATTAKEKELRRTAQKGVIKLFNAVRAAQVKGEQAEREAREKGVVGLGKREEQVKELSKQGFLDMITGGAKQKEGSVEI